MGQHTWFHKDREVFEKILKLHEELDSHDAGETYLDPIDYMVIEKEIDDLNDSNDTEYHDIFRTSKRHSDNSYIDDIFLTSLKETLEFIENPENLVSFKLSVHETEEQERERKKEALRSLKKFWEEYPNGIIRFG